MTTTFSNQEGSLGGVTELAEDMRQAGARPHWSSQVQVANIDQTVAEWASWAAVPSGAHIVQLADPQGAVFALREEPAK